MDRTRIVTIGEMNADEQVRKLRELGEDGLANDLECSSPTNTFGLLDRIRGMQPWQHNAHVFGFVPAGESIARFSEIFSASTVSPDKTLVGSCIKVALSRLGICAYPGGGEHNVLFDFYARNQIQDASEDLHFTSLVRGRDSEDVAVINYPIFIGLGVGSDGLAFRCTTVNVKSEEDEKLLTFLDSDTFKQGLRLLGAVQPAIKPLSEMTAGLARGLAARSRNVAVQAFSLGLDFQSNKMGARLAEGDFLAIQVPGAIQSKWNWKDWVLENSSGRIIKKGTQEPLAHNYMAFSVTRMPNR